jgi:hypothetical protein
MTKTAAKARVDRYGRAFKGSQLHVQVYVNARRAELDAAIRGEVPELASAGITWRAPLPEDGYAEPRDARFLKLVGLDALRGQIESFWPRGGPVWDGLASIDVGLQPGVLLLEGKSYPEEMKSACRAEIETSRRQIKRAIATTRKKLEAATDTETAWLETYYQLANRLAHLVWLRQHRVPTWLVLACFVDDHRHIATTGEEWQDGLETAGEALGLDLRRVEGLVHVSLPACTRLDLAGAGLESPRR